MAVDPQVQTILDGLAAAEGPPVTEQSPEEVRAQFALLGQLSTSVDGVESADSTVSGPGGDIPIRTYWSGSTDDRGPVLVFFHGGGFVIGDLDSHDGLCQTLCDRTGYLVIAVDYRLAPEHPFPAAPDDCVAAFDAIRARADELGFDAGRMAVGGDSAGGNLSALVALERRGQVAFQLLIYPVTDMRRTSQSSRDNAEGYLLTAEMMSWFEGHYTQGGEDLRDPRISVLFQDDVTGLAPAFVMTAEFDPLRDEGEAYAQRLADAGVAVQVRRYDGLVHGFIQMNAVVSAADSAIDDAVAALRGALG